LKADDFKRHVETIWAVATSRYILSLESLLAQNRGKPDYWAEDVRSFIERLADFAAHGSPAAPRELLKSHTSDEAAEICRRVVRRFASSSSGGRSSTTPRPAPGRGNPPGAPDLTSAAPPRFGAAIL